MSAAERKRTQLGRGERIRPGIWRLRLPLPWPGVPHVNAFALAAGDGIVLVDTGVGFAGGQRQLEIAMAQVGLELGDVRLLVCTHSHSDHYGLAAPIVEAAGCELWMHPAWEHIRAQAEDPGGTLERRIEVARQSGVPAKALELYERSRRGGDTGVERVIAPDRELIPGVRVETDHGAWDVYETPGHAPSHVVLHQRESGLMLSGDHLLGRVSVFFDYGHTPDPAGEFLASLDTVAALETDLCLAGHGRPFRDVAAKIVANRELVAEHLELVREAVAGEPRTAFEVVSAIVGEDNLNPGTAAWGLQVALAYLDHLHVLGEVERVDGSDPQRWHSR